MYKKRSILGCHSIFPFQCQRLRERERERERERDQQFQILLCFTGTGLSNTDNFAMSLVLQSLDHQLQVKTQHTYILSESYRISGFLWVYPLFAMFEFERVSKA